MLNKVKESLKSLRLKFSAENLDMLLKEANDNEYSYLQFLETILEQEEKNKFTNKIKRNLKISGLPVMKTIQEFDFKFQTTVTKRQVKGWMDFSWLENRENIIFMGPPGVGKTHLAISLGYESIQNGQKVKFYSMQSLVENMIIADSDNRFTVYLKKLLKNDLIIIDELGYLPLKPIYANLFFQLVNKAYEYRSLIITSNKTFEEWGTFFGNQTIASAIIDRLLHHAEPVIMNGDSYRLKENTKFQMKEVS